MKQLFCVFIVSMILFASCKKEKQAGLPTITTTDATNVTAASLKSGGSIPNDGGAQVFQRGIVWATHTAPTVGDSVATSGTGSGSFETLLSNLNANTKYYIRAYASNTVGTAYGNEITITTSPGLATVTTESISNVQPLSAKSGGTVSNDGGAAITERGVVYGNTANPTINNNKVSSGTGTGTFLVTLSPLGSQQAYYVRAYAINGYGTSYGNQLQFNASSANTVIDIDGNVYPYLALCGKDWLGANLKVTKYKNGDPITDGSPVTFNWMTNTAGTYAYPGGLQSNNTAFGKLYSLIAVRDARGICPTGWHVPTDLDWQAIEVCQGMDPAVAATNNDRCCGGLKFLEGGSSGMEMKRGGQMFVDYFAGGAYQYAGFGGIGQYWSTTVSAISPDFNRYREFNPVAGPDFIRRQSSDRSALMSVRCVRD